VLLRATYIMNAVWGRRPRWTISQECEWEVKRVGLAVWVGKELGKRSFRGEKRSQILHPLSHVKDDERIVFRANRDLRSVRIG
jgi:hypothetical protein